jgi:hypothetical protein
MVPGAGPPGDGQRTAGPRHRRLPHGQLQRALRHPGGEGVRLPLPPPPPGDLVQGPLHGGGED